MGVPGRSAGGTASLLPETRCVLMAVRRLRGHMEVMYGYVCVQWNERQQLDSSRSPPEWPDAPHQLGGL
jgi:hypothetical protein